MVFPRTCVADGPFVNGFGVCFRRVEPLAFASVGGACLGLPYSFGPFVALHEGKGFPEALERSRFLSRGLKTGLFFLQGFLFVVLSGGLFVLSKISNAPTLGNRVLESVAIAGVACLAGTGREPRLPTSRNPG